MNATRSLNSTLDRMITLNRAIDQAFNVARPGGSRVWVPAIDVIETKDAYVLYADLPGVDASAVNITFERNILTISGSKAPAIDATAQGDLRVYTAERVAGAFERSIRLPEFVDGDAIGADFSNGVLTVTVPKGRAAQPRQIKISQRPVAVSGSPTETPTSN
jgi:HSP20 family protein